MGSEINSEPNRPFETFEVRKQLEVIIDSETTFRTPPGMLILTPKDGSGRKVVPVVRDACGTWRMYYSGNTQSGKIDKHINDRIEEVYASFVGGLVVE